MARDGYNALPRSQRLTKLILAGLIALYSVSNLVLLVVSCVAWSSAKDRADSRDCTLMGFVGCGFTRWALYSFIAAAALICFLITAIMALSSVFRTRGAALDPLYVFRGVFFTLLLLAPIIYLGWSNLIVVLSDANAYFTRKAQVAICEEWDRSKPKFSHTPDDDHVCNTRDTHTGVSFGGLGGVFILEVMDPDFLSAKAAFAMAHFNLMLGASVAGVAAALAPPAGILVGVHGVSNGAP
ncbi:Uncharacterized protein TPAR_07652 [Tolypocladium paradoxum]|uniref:Uncharacterized protein n=1 Tax=Tolypocladium paradoxum TaxID=94208 RepID=A0A2S4KPT4_9HYPO|nr:Uncharacterized protein TPAR_07652 [Tolypocladium paradoxum]